MSDFRIQKATNAATKECMRLIDHAYQKELVIKKNELMLSILSQYQVSITNAEKIIEMTTRGRFTIEGDELIPIKKKVDNGKDNE